MIRRIDSAALLVRSVPYGEADIVATFITEEQGKVSAIVRGARRSTKRFGGALEPIHELSVVLEDRGRELCVLKEARVRTPRTAITSNLETMEAAGQALRWLRHLCPPRTPEPEAWRQIRQLFDALSDGVEAFGAEVGAKGARGHLAMFGLRLLGSMGYALELERCVGCGRSCPDGRPAFLDAGRGGIVCTSCGGARRAIRGELRRQALDTQRSAHRGEELRFSPECANEIIAIVEETMTAHAGFDPRA